jgi:8-oxo-dGTP diphosphatase
VTTIAVAVVLRSGWVLVGRRAAEAVDAAGLDEFPGGKVENGERPADAAARECREEAGIAVGIGPLLDRVTAASAAGPLEILFFTARPLDDAPPRAPFAWVPLEDLAARRFPTANDGALARLRQGGS